MAQDRAKDNRQDAAEELAKMRGGASSEASRPEPELCGDIGMKIARDGTWYYQGSPIRRIALSKLFSTVLRKEEDGIHYLVTPVEKVSVEVEDSPFVAVAMDVTGEGADQTLRFRTNLDDDVEADGEHPLSFRSEEDGSFTPFVRVRGALEARIARSVFYDLVERAVEKDGELGIWSSGSFFPFPESD
ncbi:hypothetical protein A7A08_02279 [Methyloligella halotolerans]|uniref:Proteophosphoglycan n=1 Tax=Methyloligella halotolerans TaxID=1177755 RepID=A0A1E2RXV7_9HYPH|nr:DUF1285 domain-containing protein [Methyloligella halotolerans]ODA66982.1 hypothetical protein A7A08_02279 [Methyloligella halotolerans]